jgi:soluble lytic murein transglycosylase-like protein
MAEPTSQVRRADVAVQNRIEAGITKAAERYDLPEALIRAVVQAESGFKVRAVSPAGARGLMQLMPGTAKEMGVTDPFDIEQNIDGGSRYLRSMLDRFDGDVRLALSAYNAGPGTVAKYNGRVPYAETRNYGDRVLRFVRLSA